MAGGAAFIAAMSLFSQPAPSVHDPATWQEFCRRPSAAGEVKARMGGREALVLCSGERLQLSGRADLDRDGKISDEERKEEERRGFADSREQLRQRRQLPESRDYQCGWLYHAEREGAGILATRIGAGPQWLLRPAWKFRSERERGRGSLEIGTEAECRVAQGGG